MKRLLLITLLSLAFFCLPCAGSPTAADASEVPFDFQSGYVIVPAKIKGDVPVEVVLATGAEYSIVNVSLLQKYKLNSYYTGDGIITGGNLDRTISYSTVPDIRVGDVKLSSLNMRFGSLGGADERAGREIFCVLGADFFKGRIVQFDFGKKVVRFLQANASDAAKDNTTNGGAAIRTVLPIRFNKEELTLPVVEDVTFDGKKIKTLLDTGTPTVLSLSSSATKQLGLTAPPENSAPIAGKVGSLRLGSYELANIPLTLHARGTAFDRSMKEYGAIAGSVFLQNFIVTFDFRKKVVTLERI
jgi:hypothetical protein